MFLWITIRCRSDIGSQHQKSTQAWVHRRKTAIIPAITYPVSRISKNPGQKWPFKDCRSGPTTFKTSARMSPPQPQPTTQTMAEGKKNPLPEKKLRGTKDVGMSAQKERRVHEPNGGEKKRSGTSGSGDSARNQFLRVVLEVRLRF